MRTNEPKTSSSGTRQKQETWSLSSLPTKKAQTSTGVTPQSLWAMQISRRASMCAQHPNQIELVCVPHLTCKRPSQALRPPRSCCTLQVAAGNGHLDVVKYLVEKAGADMKTKCDYGETAFQYVEGHPTEANKAATAYMKMKTAMNAVLAAQKFAASAAKPQAEKETA